MKHPHKSSRARASQHDSVASLNLGALSVSDPQHEDWFFVSSSIILSPQLYWVPNMFE